MSWKNRLKNYNFWISIFSAVLLILQALKIEFDIAYVNEIFTAVLGLLVVIGIISDPTRTTTKAVDETSIKTESAVASNDKVEEEKQGAKKGEIFPANEKNETDKLFAEIDIKTILNEITNDLNVKLNELKTANNETKLLVEKMNLNKNLFEEIVGHKDEVDVNVACEELKDSLTSTQREEKQEEEQNVSVESSVSSSYLNIL